MGQIVKEVHKIMMTVLRGRKGMESYPSGIEGPCYSFAPGSFMGGVDLSYV